MLQPSAVIVKKVLNYISDEKLNSDKYPELTPTIYAGYLIGILERILIATLVFAGQIPTIGFVIAVKKYS